MSSHILLWLHFENNVKQSAWVASRCINLTFTAVRFVLQTHIIPTAVNTTRQVIPLFAVTLQLNTHITFQRATYQVALLFFSTKGGGICLTCV